MSLRLRVFAAAVLVAIAAFAGGATTSLAVLTSQAILGANAFTTGTWGSATLYLHNIPTPPTGATTAQGNLAMNAATPTATTLFNYDTDCDGTAGRSIVRGTGLVSDVVACHWANWRGPALAAARTYSGNATATVWARKTGSGGTNPTLRAYVRDLDPSTSTYAELGNASATITTDGAVALAKYTLTIALNATVPTGHQVELRLLATGGNRDVTIAYDTTANASSLSLP